MRRFGDCKRPAPFLRCVAAARASVVQLGPDGGEPDRALLLGGGLSRYLGRRRTGAVAQHATDEAGHRASRRALAGRPLRRSRLCRPLPARRFRACGPSATRPQEVQQLLPRRRPHLPHEQCRREGAQRYCPGHKIMAVRRLGPRRRARRGDVHADRHRQAQQRRPAGLARPGIAVLSPPHIGPAAHPALEKPREQAARPVRGVQRVRTGRGSSYISPRVSPTATPASRACFAWCCTCVPTRSSSPSR